jgi:leucyl/phenylalanyl-tRNA---protein transferase
MPLYALDKKLIFPPVHYAEPDGLLAIGGDLTVERLLLAYRSGIFPWYEEEHILWWCPDPRFILLPQELKVSKSMMALLKKNEFDFTIDRAFAKVIRQCKTTARPGQDGTWITDEVEKAFCKLHELGYAQSAEVWKDGELVGGLYGIRMGKIFFGESMFSNMNNASKYAFIKYTNYLSEQGIELIDCQVYTEHLQSLGAKMIERKDFIMRLRELIDY